MVCTLPPPPPPHFSAGGGVESPTKFFKKSGGLDMISIFKGGCLESGDDFFRGGGGGKGLPQAFWGLLYGTKNSILQLSFEFNLHIDIYFFVCLFLLLLNYKAIGAHLH